MRHHVRRTIGYISERVLFDTSILYQLLMGREQSVIMKETLIYIYEEAVDVIG